MNELSLDFMTATEVAPPSFVSIAAEAGFRFVSLLIQPTSHHPNHDMIGDTPMHRETRRRLSECGVTVDVIEAFYLRPEKLPEHFCPALESGAALGARNVVVVTQDSDPSRLLDRFAEFCGLAAGYGLGVFLEYTPRMTQRTFAEALAFVKSAGIPNVRIEADALHTFRGGTVLSEMAAHGADTIGRAQLCDAPNEIAAESGWHEAVFDRMIPGEGNLPLRDFVDSIPDSIVVGVEVPSKSLREQGVGAQERVRRALEGTRRIMGSRQSISNVML